VSELDDILDSVDAFTNVHVDLPLDESQLEQLRGRERALVDVVSDAGAPTARRFAAAEALLALAPPSALAPADSAAVAQALAQAIREDRLHNRWGLPGYVVGRAGGLLLSLPAGVDEALLPLLDDARELVIDGSEEATIQHMARYRVGDLAAYLLAQRHGLEWQNSEDPSERDRDNARIRSELA
jgi:hypothetical protein